MSFEGRLTKMLNVDSISAGYTLTEDEDFLYLHVPGTTVPVVFSAVGASIANVEAEILRLEANKK